MSRNPLRRLAREVAREADGVLLDAYGVLNHTHGALPGAAEFVAWLAAERRPFLVVTNDASRSATTCAARFAAMGLPIAAEQILTAGSLLVSHFAAAGLAGARCLVLGTGDSRAYVALAGGVLCGADDELDAVVVCDEVGYDFLAGVDGALSALCRAIDRGREPVLILPNPDLIYPAQGGFGYTSGAAALLLEAGLARRYPGGGRRFTALGKPHRPIFDQAIARLGSARLVMIGDQLETDIAGAQAAGLATALVETGVSRWRPGDAIAPDFVLADLT